MQILFIYSKFTFPIADSEYTFERREEQSKADQHPDDNAREITEILKLPPPLFLYFYRTSDEPSARRILRHVLWKVSFTSCRTGFGAPPVWWTFRKM